MSLGQQLLWGTIPPWSPVTQAFPLVITELDMGISVTSPFCPPCLPLRLLLVLALSEVRFPYQPDPQWET